jgi:guanylate kinase
MRKRGQDSEDVIARRLAAAREEMSHFGEFDYVIVNEVFDTAVDEMCAIFTASRLRRNQQIQRHHEMIQQLLK